MCMYFLDLVGTGGVPTATVTISDNIVNWFEENTKEFWIIFILGIFAGITISWLWRWFASLFNDESEIDNEKTETTKEDGSDN